MATRNENRWNEMFEIYKEYVNTVHEFPRTTTVFKKRSLGQWFRVQLQLYKENSLSQERIIAFDKFNPYWKAEPDEKHREEKRMLIESDWKSKLSPKETPIDEFFKDGQLYTCLSNGIYSCYNYLKFFEDTYGQDFTYTTAKMSKDYNGIFSLENKKVIYNTTFPNLNFDILNIMFNVYEDMLNPYKDYVDFSFITTSKMFNSVCPDLSILSDNMNSVLNHFPEKETDIFLKRYRDNMQITDIAAEYGFSGNNAAQYLRKVARRLRHPNRKDMLNVFMFRSPAHITGKPFPYFKEPEFHSEVISALIKAEIYTPKQLQEIPLEELQKVLDKSDFLLVCANLELLKRKEERYTPVINNPNCAPPVKELLEEDIESLKMTVRTYNCLKRAGINTVGELSLLTEVQFDNIRFFSLKCKTEVQEKMASLGFDFPYNPENTEKKSLSEAINNAEKRNTGSKGKNIDTNIIELNR